VSRVPEQTSVSPNPASETFDMTIELHWPAIALRLVLTIVAGIVLGAERSKSGHPAGLRTTLLVTLAASLSMIQMNLMLPTNGKPHDSYAVMNLMLPTNGKPHDSYAVMDLMRLPLGILTGVGFIGAGAIIRKGEMVMGVTTAATMWFSTVVGLCLGGGQVVLGSTATVMGFLILWALRFAENRLETYQRGVLTVASEAGDVSTESLTRMLHAESMHVKSTSALYEGLGHRNKFRFEVRWHCKESGAMPEIVERLRELPGIASCEWSGSGEGTNW
jgi:putative Mg2+ transporter-C (MgtC) family protein